MMVASAFIKTAIRTQSRLARRQTIRGYYGSFENEYARSISDPEGFWSKAASDLHWFEAPSKILESHGPNNTLFRWFPDGKINTCYNAVDIHCSEGRGDQVAILYDSPVTNTKQSITYFELLKDVSDFAGVLVHKLGVQKGDRVIIYMPMIPQAVVAMLACCRIGAVHSVVFGGFASNELASRIDDCRPKVVVTASCGVLGGGRIVEFKPLVDGAMEMARHKVESCVVVQRRDVHECEMNVKSVGGRDEDYDDLMSRCSGPHDAVPLRSTDPHYVLYTSGTTDRPKGVVRDTGGYATALKWSMGAFYDTRPGEVYWSGSDIGWVVGHSYIVYGPLLQGCTTVLFEGKPVGTPDAGAYWRVIEEYGVKTLFSTPTAFRAIKQADPDGTLIHNYDISSFKALFLAGERSDPDTLRWCEAVLNQAHGNADENSNKTVPVIDHWWQTELGWPGVGNALGLGLIPPKHGACAAPVCGYDICVVDDSGNKLPPGQLGHLIAKLPLPPGTFPTLYNNEDKYHREYLDPFPGYYATGDEAIIDDEGYVHILGRTDDVINVAGHRLSTGSMEEILLDHPDVADCAVIGVHDELRGQVPVGFVTTIQGSTIKEDQLCRDLIASVRERIGPVAFFKKVRVVTSLPKTRSGKTLRGTMQKIADGEDYVITPTIEDPLVFETLAPQIVELVKRP